MILLAPLALAFILGLSVVALLTHRVALPQKFLFGMSVALPLGFGIASLLLFWSYVIAAPQVKVVMPALTALLLLGILVRHIRLRSFQDLIHFMRHGLPQFKTTLQTWDPRGKSLSGNLNKGFTLAAAAFYGFMAWHYGRYFTGRIVWNIWGGWDAQYFWNLKAKFLFRDPAQWTGMFSPILSWSHPDYPLLLPGTLAWGWHLAGHEFLLWAPAVDFVFFVSLNLFVVWYLGTAVSWISGFLTGGYLLSVPVYRFWSTTQYADIPLAYFFTTAAVLLLLALRTRALKLFFFAGLMAGLSAWTKNEGLFYLGWLGLLLTVALLRGKNLDSPKLPRLVWFIAGILIAFSAVLYAKVFLGLEGGEYLGSGRNLAEYIKALFFDSLKTRIIAGSFWVYLPNYSQWHGLWLLFLTAWLLGGRRTYQEYRWIPGVLVLLIEAGYFIVLHWAPNEIYFQISVSMLRLLMHAGALALVFAVEAAGPLRLKDHPDAC